MIVDDEEDLVWTAKKQLSAANAQFDVVGFSLPRAALQSCSTRAPQVLVTDVRMPDMNGLQLLQAVRDHNPTVHVIVTTAFRDDEVTTRASRDGAIVFLPKPYGLAELRRLVDQALKVPTGFQGALSFSGLPDLIQLQMIARASQVLELEHNGELGRVWFVEGNVVHAECGRMIGAEAFFRLLGWPAGTFRVQPAPHKSPEPSIHASTMELLMEGIRLMDEAARFPSSEVSSSDSIDNQLEEQTVGNVKESLAQAMSIDGAVGVALVDYKSGMALGTAGGGPVNLEVAAAGNTEVVRAKMKVMQSLGIKGGIEDILITLGDQYHLIRMIASKPNLFLYLVLARDKANLAMARHNLSELETGLQT